MHWHSITVASLILVACSDGGRKRHLGDTCSLDGACESGVCLDAVCVDPSGDADHDGIPNGSEQVVDGMHVGGVGSIDGDASDGNGGGDATADGTDAPDGVDGAADASDATVPNDMVDDAVSFAGVYSIVFDDPIDVSRCIPGETIMWNSQAFTVKDDGSFNENSWKIAGDNQTVAVMQGILDARLFDADFRCAATSGAMHLHAERTVDGADYIGTHDWDSAPTPQDFHIHPPPGR